MKALIVEDDYITSEVMKEILSSVGEAEVAENGQIAVDKFMEALDSDNKYDIVFLDIMMPEMDGQDTLRNIRKAESDRNILGLDSVKIVMTTALDDFHNVKSAFKSQCEGYLVKPVEKDKVINTLQDLKLI